MAMAAMLNFCCIRFPVQNFSIRFFLPFIAFPVLSNYSQKKNPKHFMLKFTFSDRKRVSAVKVGNVNIVIVEVVAVAEVRVMNADIDVAKRDMNERKENARSVRRSWNVRIYVKLR